MIVFVEGNIAAGKTTFLKYIDNNSKWKDVCRVIYEPINSWQNLNNNNLLDMFYKESDNNISSDLQYHIILTMINNHLKAKQFHPQNNIVFMERSAISGVECFAKVLNKIGKLRNRSYDILKEGIKNIMVNLQQPDHIIYLKVDDVHILMDRISKRGRDCENNNNNNNNNNNILNEDYLNNLNDAYNDMIECYGKNIPVTIIPTTTTTTANVNNICDDLITGWM